MRPFVITLIVFCGLADMVCGQSHSASIDSLVKYRIISSKERPVLEKELRAIGGRSSYRVAVLRGLENIMLQKEFHVDPHKTGAVFYGNQHLNKKSQDSVNISLHRLLNKINKSGLLTDRVYTNTLKGIDSSSYMAELQVMGHLTEMSSRLEWLAAGRLLPVAEQLHKKGIVSDSSFLRLQNDIKDGKIESAFQLNDYCQLDRVFDLTKYSDDPDVWLEQIHRDIASMVPGLNFTNFSYITLPDTSFSMPEVRFKVSLVCNGRMYKYSSLAFINFKNKQGKISPKEIFVEDFYRIFNKILTDQQSPLRLHSIMFSPGTTIDDRFRRFALIALRGEQSEIFMHQPCLSYMMLSMDDYNNSLTSARIDSTIAACREIGLFAHLSETEIEKAIDNTEADNLYTMNKLLSNFPQVVYPLDSALMSPQYPYASILKHLAGITHGALKPDKITQTKVKGGVKLQYLSKGIVHSYTFNTKNGWLDARFSAFLKHLSQENNLPGAFYLLRYENSVIYLTKFQYDYAVKHNLLDFGREI